mgnify:FL=1
MRHPLIRWPRLSPRAWRILLIVLALHAAPFVARYFLWLWQVAFGQARVLEFLAPRAW